MSYGTDPEGALIFGCPRWVEPSHEEPIGQRAARDRQVAAMAGQLAELVEVNEALAAKLARLEHGAERMLEGWDEQRRDHGA